MIIYIKFSTDGYNNWNSIINETNPNTLDDEYFNNRDRFRGILEYTVRRFSRAGRYISLELTHENGSEKATITFTHNTNRHTIDLVYDGNGNFLLQNSDIVLTQQSLYNVMSSFYIFDKKEEDK